MKKSKLTSEDIEHLNVLAIRHLDLDAYDAKENDCTGFHTALTIDEKLTKRVIKMFFRDFWVKKDSFGGSVEGKDFVVNTVDKNFADYPISIYEEEVCAGYGESNGWANAMGDTHSLPQYLTELAMFVRNYYG